MRVRSAVLGAGMSNRFARYVRRLDLPSGSAGADARPVTDGDLAGLPVAAQRWLRRAGVVGRPRDRSVTVHWAGRFRLRPGQRWMPFEAWQHDTALPAARAYSMRLDAAGVLPVFGTDTYLEGHGRMRGRLLGVLPVADGAGPEFDVGELVTWLDDVVLFAPSMLLAPPVTWAGEDEDAFDVTVGDAGLVATVRVRLDETGRVRDVSTEDRWCALPSGPVRARWTTPVDGWTTVSGRPVPLYARAFWDLPDGTRWTYASVRIRPRSVHWNVPPSWSAAGAGARRAEGPGPIRDRRRGVVGDVRPYEEPIRSANLGVPDPTRPGEPR